MKAWEYVINTAMLGTDKQIPSPADLPEEITGVAALIDASETADKEVKFLQKAAAIYNYRQCGFTPLEQKELPVHTASPETSPYCTEAASAILSDILNEEPTALLGLWLSHCHQTGKILLPDVLPAVLDVALKDKSLQPLAVACCGNRGLWLSGLNPSWDYFSTVSDKELWQTGKPDERAGALEKLRTTDPDMAREWLQQTWPQETAASKADLLKTFRVNAGAADQDWLESLWSEKGQKVKEEVVYLLKRIPGSSIIKLYEGVLREAVMLKKEKALLGMMTKVSIQFKLPSRIDEAIFKSGIEKLSGQKSPFSDEEFIIYQLIESVPPAFWEQRFEAAPAQVVQYFEKYAPAMTGALGMAVSRFKAASWMPYFLHLDGFYVDFIDFLNPPEQEKYLLRFFKPDPRNAIHYALQLKQEWSADFAITVLREMANYPYEYNRASFNKHIRLIPVTIINQVKAIEPKDLNLLNTWAKNRDHLLKLLRLKQQTLNAFNA
ncbi:hypothetical protein BEL04_08815 [Mucilaginibacter sp. PPCGB 2223]|uniref:DUF5691 domain-containing protein n=1 Tax=Mucilaginibacter sp. PPCGB 2223 TaxID=1886027 RepID=UPI000825C105|nr:DUF5691 domain-containing protein [Mucilaginibacter sp. PPCGB 2223]OCX54348.1 hypothetical protein BEL04_08815 [Mucilaginibacter sp. PPCGB 2223]